MYAATLVDVAQDAQEAFDLYNQLAFIASTIRGHHDLNEALVNGGLPVQAQKNLIEDLFSEQHRAVVELLVVMAERGEFGLLSRVKQAVLETAEERFSAILAEVTTAVSLNDHLRDVIKQKLSADFGKDIVLSEHIDPSILGGIVMSARGKRLDASLATQLVHARNVLSHVSVGGEK